LAQLPSWAQETLRRHASDPRRRIPREQLAAGHSGDNAWDGMQRYLVETGELHNNARMGWGKAVASWAASPDDALQLLLELNNRFALDGHAPPSYGGLLGCLGLFEGPAQAEGRVLGRVAFKPPKPKYAALPSVAHLLGASSPKGAGPGAPSVPVGRVREVRLLPCGDAAEEHRAGAEPRKRRWTAKLRPGQGACIDVA